LRANAFLSMYRVLEGILNEKYADEIVHSSVVMTYLAAAESEPVRARLNICREIRNLLTHSADENGAPLVEPSQEALDDLYDVIKFIETPRSALNFATKADKILCATKSARVMDIMNAMEKRGFSHVPILAGGEIAGVFCRETVFLFLLAGKELTRETRIGDIEEFTSFERNNGKYLIMDDSANYYDVRREFEIRSRANKKLAVIFITSTGEANGRLLGMITPWDVLDDNK